MEPRQSPAGIQCQDGESSEPLVTSEIRLAIGGSREDVATSGLRRLGIGVLLMLLSATVALTFFTGARRQLRGHVATGIGLLELPPLSGGAQKFGRGRSGELFCFCVMRAGEEQAVLEEQARLQAGIFDCDDQVVYSDAPVRLGKEVHATVIGALTSQQGGAMTSSWVNTDNFLQAWE